MLPPCGVTSSSQHNVPSQVGSLVFFPAVETVTLLGPPGCPFTIVYEKLLPSNAQQSTGDGVGVGVGLGVGVGVGLGVGVGVGLGVGVGVGLGVGVGVGLGVGVGVGLGVGVGSTGVELVLVLEPESV